MFTPSLTYPHSVTTLFLVRTVGYMELVPRTVGVRQNIPRIPIPALFHRAPCTH